MKTLNLANQIASSIKYDVISFSDTQKLLKLKFAVGEKSIRIISRFSWDDAQLITQAVSILRSNGVEKIVLDIPYMLGARSDRNFDPGYQAHYMKQVIAPIINSLQVDKVVVIDPHSHVTEACINNIEIMSKLPFLVGRMVKLIGDRPYCLISPDAGAQHRTEEVEKKIEHGKNYKGIIQCSKTREKETGKITGIQLHDDVSGLDCIVVDDLCDGGRTFVELAKVLNYADARDMYLCISHAIFSAGLKDLLGFYKIISCTDSAITVDKMVGMFVADKFKEGDFVKRVSVLDVLI